MFFEEGLYKFNKPLGWSSFDVVNWVKKRTTVKKVGHGGTLDPLAEGLLIIAVGRTATSSLEKILGYDKEYILEITFGLATDTYDKEGSVIAEKKDFVISQEELLAVLDTFKGETEQLPPMYSALKVNGQKLYQLARAGKTVERQPRKIQIHELELLDYNNKDKARLRVVCSKGTYIRTLCYDIGQKLEVPAHLSFLRRTRIGDFVLDETAVVPVGTRREKDETGARCF